jgi:hypothetical protein
MFHKCQEILTDTINYILEYEAVKPLIITEYYLEKTSVQRQKQIFEEVSQNSASKLLLVEHELNQL